MPSKHVGAIDPDLAGDVSREETTDDSKGSDIDDDDQESEGNAYDPQSGSSDPDDLGDDDDHETGTAEENFVDAQNNESTKDADDPEESTKDAADPEESTKDAADPASKARADRAAAVANCNRVTKEAAELEKTRGEEAGPATEFNPDKLEAVDTPELAALRLKPRRYPPRKTVKVPLTYKESSSSVNDNDVVNKGAFYQTVIYISTLHFHFTFQL